MGAIWLCKLFIDIITPVSGNKHGEVSERFKETVLKTVVPETVPWVRIPPSPPICYTSHARRGTQEAEGVGLLNR
jgi:hypothetical protein